MIDTGASTSAFLRPDGGATPLILHVITDLGMGGAEMVLLNLVRGGSRYRHAIVSLRGRGALGDEIAAAGAPVYCLDLPRGLAAAPFRLPAMVRSLRPAVVQGWLVHGNLAALWASRLSGRPAPTAWSIHQSIIDIGLEARGTRHLLRLAGRLSSLPDRIIYCSEASRRDHERLGYSPEPGRLIRNGFDLSLFAPSPARRAAARRRLGVSPDTLVIGIVARVHPQKGHRILFEAAERVLAEGRRDIRFLLVGDGTGPDDDAWRKLAPGGALRERIIPLGRRNDVPEWMQAMDVLASPSLTEALPNVIGEAMATGVPCVVTDVGDCGWMVGDSGLVVPARDPVALAGALARMHDMPAPERAALGSAARRRAAGEFGLDRMVAGYDELYANLIAARQKRPRADG